MHASTEPEIEKPANNDNDVSISDAETQSGNEHSPSDNEKDNDEVHEDTQTNNKEPDNDAEIEPTVDLDNPQPKNKRCDKRDFMARKHGKEREPWVQKPMPFLKGHAAPPCVILVIDDILYGLMVALSYI